MSEPTGVNRMNSLRRAQMLHIAPSLWLVQLDIHRDTGWETVAVKRFNRKMQARAACLYWEQVINPSREDLHGHNTIP